MILASNFTLFISYGCTTYLNLMHDGVDCTQGALRSGSGRDFEERWLFEYSSDVLWLNFVLCVSPYTLVKF